MRSQKNSENHTSVGLLKWYHVSSWTVSSWTWLGIGLGLALGLGLEWRSRNWRSRKCHVPLNASVSEITEDISQFLRVFLWIFGDQRYQNDLWPWKAGCEGSSFLGISSYICLYHDQQRSNLTSNPYSEGVLLGQPSHLNGCGPSVSNFLDLVLMRTCFDVEQPYLV